MNKTIDIETNSSSNVNLFDTHDITINRGEGNDVELVIHPCRIGKVNVRFAKEPYHCTLFLANGTEMNVDLWDESDWGNIQPMIPYDYFKEGEHAYPKDFANRIGWGSDADGHIEIVKVEDEFGQSIPLDVFKQDVKDFIIYFEG